MEEEGFRSRIHRREGMAQIGLADQRVINEFFRRALGEDSAVVDDDAAVADFQRPLDVMVGDEDGLAQGLLELADFALEILDGDRVYPGKGFIQKDQGGVW